MTGGPNDRRPAREHSAGLLGAAKAETAANSLLSPTPNNTLGRPPVASGPEGFPTPVLSYSLRGAWEPCPAYRYIYDRGAGPHWGGILRFLGVFMIGRAAKAEDVLTEDRSSWTIRPFAQRALWNQRGFRVRCSVSGDNQRGVEAKNCAVQMPKFPSRGAGNSLFSLNYSEFSLRIPRSGAAECAESRGILSCVAPNVARPGALSPRCSPSTDRSGPDTAARSSPERRPASARRWHLTIAQRPRPSGCRPPSGSDPRRSRARRRRRQ